ncbi:MAG: Hypothetical protein LKU_02031 [Lactobacillus kefiranofaciens]
MMAFLLSVIIATEKFISKAFMIKRLIVMVHLFFYSLINYIKYN